MDLNYVVAYEINTHSSETRPSKLLLHCLYDITGYDFKNHSRFERNPSLKYFKSLFKKGIESERLAQCQVLLCNNKKYTANSEQENIWGMHYEYMLTILCEI